MLRSKKRKTENPHRFTSVAAPAGVKCGCGSAYPVV